MRCSSNEAEYFTSLLLDNREFWFYLNCVQRQNSVAYKDVAQLTG